MSRRRKIQPPPPGTIDVPTVAVVCGGAGEHARAKLYDLLDGRDIGQGDVVLWQGDSPERSWAGEVPVFAFRCPRCRRDTPMRLLRLQAEIDAARAAHPERLRPVVDIARPSTGLLP